MHIVSVALMLLAAPFAAKAQQPQQPLTPEEKEKQIYDYIDKQIEDYSYTLKLSGAQVFFLDSILTHNTFAMMRDVEELQRAKMSIADAYQMVQDKWNEATYQAMNELLDEEQWAKYLKTGGSKDKKARDKRAEKRAK